MGGNMGRVSRGGFGLHARTIDHHPAGSAYQRFNKRVATQITSKVGTMTCAYLFAGLGIVAMYGAFTANVTLTLIAGSISGYFLQLVLLPALMVGQNLQTAASDARAAQTFDDTEKIIGLLDVHTEGGIAELAGELHAIREILESKAKREG